jgi:HSP20 family protein
MATQQAMQPTQEPAPSRPIYVEAEKLFEQMKDLTQSVAQRAYQFFEARGREFGHDLEDWFRAETEVTRRVPVEIRETETQLIVRAEIPGYSANDIKVSVEPKRLIISAKSETQTEEKKEEKVYSEFHSNQFFRDLSLPVEVDPTQTNATLKDGVLELSFVKAGVKQPFNVEVKNS